ncbi:hypothetical protein BASA81_002202 [Batrachochytrium salamandrivorans]|nr:hypothetical protein BASA81_002202 [Batrachochytrium salamandrivorans]
MEAYTLQDEEERMMLDRYAQLLVEIHDLKSAFAGESHSAFEHHVTPTLPKRFVPPAPKPASVAPPPPPLPTLFVPPPLPAHPIPQIRSSTPVYNRLLKKGVESQVKLANLREQLQEQSSRPFAGNIPRINDTSRRMVEAKSRSYTHSASALIPASSMSHASSFTMPSPSSSLPTGVWKEHATSETTTWEKPESFAPVKLGFSLDQAKRALS